MYTIKSKFTVHRYNVDFANPNTLFLKLLYDNIDYSQYQYPITGATTGTLTDDYIEFPAAPINNLTDFTISCWISSEETEFTILSARRNDIKVIEWTNLTLVINGTPFEGEVIMATIKRSYAPSAALTVTGLQSLASSQTYVAGWTSGWINNASDKHEDKLVSGKVVMASSNNQAGQIRVYVYTDRYDATPPDIFSAGTEGTEGTATLHSTAVRDTALKLLHAFDVPNTASAVYEIPKCSVAALFNGVLPDRFALFVTGNGTTTTTAQLASSTNEIHVQGTYREVL